MRRNELGRFCLWLAIGLTLLNFMVVLREGRGASNAHGKEPTAERLKEKKHRSRGGFFHHGPEIDPDPESLGRDETEELRYIPKQQPEDHVGKGRHAASIHDPGYLKNRILRDGAGGAGLTARLYGSLGALASANGAMSRLASSASLDQSARATLARLHNRDLGWAPPPVSRSHKPLECLRPGDVHVVYTANSPEYGAMLASAYSALRNTQNPNRLLFHFIIPHTADADELCSMLSVYAQAYPEVVCPVSAPLPREYGNVRECKFSMNTFEAGSGRKPCMCGLHFHILQFDPAAYPVMEHIRRSSKDRKELLSQMNFARNFIDDLLLPWGVERIIYMDADTIVQGDLRALWLTKFKSNNFFAPAHTCNQPWSFWFNFKSWVISNSMLKEDGCAVNAGVYMLDVKQYAAHKIQHHIAELIAIHEKRLQGKMKGIWRRGVHQPSFVFSLYNHTQRVDSKWNMGQLGWDEHLSLDELREAYILHWNGQRKPWKSDGLFKQFWMPYALPLPAPRNALLLGNCLVNSEDE